jgi:signal transduction histidine kinase
MGRIRKETQDSPQERYRLNALDQLISGKFDELSFLLGLNPKNNYELSDTLKARAWLGNQQMDRIRALVFQFQSAEQSLLRQRSKELSARYAAFNAIVITSLVIAFLLVVYGFITYARENTARRKADETVFVYQEQLKERINELARANNELIQVRSIEKLAATELLISTKFTEMVYQRISVYRLLDETLVLARDRMQLNHIKIRKYYTTEISEISVDVERIKIVFLNTIVKAIEAIVPDKGVLKLKTENREKQCVVTISDNGSGMSNESIARLFEPYFTSKQAVQDWASPIHRTLSITTMET